jgi:hypothetical protein
MQRLNGRNKKTAAKQNTGFHELGFSWIGFFEQGQRLEDATRVYPTILIGHTIQHNSAKPPPPIVKPQPTTPPLAPHLPFENHPRPPIVTHTIA